MTNDEVLQLAREFEQYGRDGEWSGIDLIAFANAIIEKQEDEHFNLKHLLGHAYSKLIKYGVENTDPLLMDEIKLELMR